VNKLVVIMAHLRRIRTSEVKQIQAFRPLQQHERQDLTALLASIVGVEDCDCSASLFDHSFGQKCVSHLFSAWVCGSQFLRSSWMHRCGGQQIINTMLSPRTTRPTPKHHRRISRTATKTTMRNRTLVNGLA
jgi:hypothetical protein